MKKVQALDETVALLSSRKEADLEAARAALSEALEAEDEGLRESAVRLLLGELARPESRAQAEVLMLLQSGWWPIQVRMATVAVNAVLAALRRSSEDGPEADDAALLLTSICREDPTQLAALEKALGETTPAVRRAAAGAVGRVGEPALGMLPLLVALAEGPSDAVASAAVESMGALASLAPDVVAPALLRQLLRATGVRRYLALATLRGLLDEARQEGKARPAGLEELTAAVLPALDDTEPSARLEAVGLLGLVPATRLADAALRRHLSDESPDVAAHAATALMRLTPTSDEARRTLDALLHDEQAERHGAALDALEGLEPAVLFHLRPTLEEAAKSAPEPVRATARELLATLG